MLDMYILSAAVEQEIRSCPRAAEALRAEWRTADTTGVVGPRLRAALRCAVFEDPFYRERAKKLQKQLESE
jgi:hypothetical protein